MGMHELRRVRAIVLKLPEVNERMSHGAPCFFVRDRAPICYFHDRHRGDGRMSLWCPAAPGVQDAMVFADPERFFRPPTSRVGHFRDWLGAYIDNEGDVDWTNIASILEGAYRIVAPRELIAQLDAR